MRWFSFFILLLIATLLEAGNLLNLFAIGGWYIRPSLLITMLVYYALACRSHDAIICAFIIGFAADLTGGANGLIGPHMLCFGVLGLLLNQCNQILLLQRAHFKAIIVLLIYIIAETLAYWLGLIKGQESRGAYYSIILFTGIYSAIIAPVVWSILASLAGGLRQQNSRTTARYP